MIHITCNLIPSAQGSDLLLCWLAINVLTLCDKLCSHIEVIVDILPNQIQTPFSSLLSLSLS